MTGSRLDNLPDPLAKYDLAKQFMPRAIVKAGSHGFDTLVATTREDQHRADMLVRPGLGCSRREREATAQRIREVREFPCEIGTLASATASRDHRRRIAGALWALADRQPPNTFSVVTIIPGWRWDLDGFRQLDLAGLVPRLRQVLGREGLTQQDGALIAWPHGEYNPYTELLDIHWHGVASGEKLMGLGQLRKTRFKKQLGEATRLKIQPLINPPRQLSYLLKSFWPSRWRGPTPNGCKKAKRQQRMPPKWEVELLVKLNRVQVTNLTLMMGMRVTRHGFELVGAR